MFLFKEKTESRLGIDIGTSAIKVVELKKKKGRHELTNYGVFPLTHNFEEGLSRQIYLEPLRFSADEISEALARVLKEGRIKSRQTYFAVPVYSSFSTLIDLPPMPSKEISLAVSFEAKKYVPVPVSEVVLDWSLIDSSDKSGIKVLLVAVLKQTINDYARIAQLAGLKMLGAEIETFSLSRVLVGNDKSPIVLVDTGARSSNISVVDKGYIRSVNNLEAGGIEITKAVVNGLKVGREEAEELKKIGQPVEKQKTGLKEAMAPALDSIIFEIKKVIDGYQRRNKQKIEKCILAGSGLQVVGGLEYFAAKLNIEVSMGNPFARVIYPPLLESKVREIGSSLAVAVGLAMRE